MYKVTFEDTELSVEILEPGTAKINDKKVDYDLAPIEDNLWNIIANNKSYNARIVSKDDVAKTVTVLVNNRTYTVTLRDRFDELLEKMGMTVGADALLNELKAPMPGLVVEVVAKAGQQVEKGDTLLILEAMKMENVIKAAASSTVKATHVEHGQTVEKNQLLMTFE